MSTACAVATFCAWWSSPFYRHDVPKAVRRLTADSNLPPILSAAIIVHASSIPALHRHRHVIEVEVEVEVGSSFLQVSAPTCETFASLVSCAKITAFWLQVHLPVVRGRPWLPWCWFVRLVSRWRLSRGWVGKRDRKEQLCRALRSNRLPFSHTARAWGTWGRHVVEVDELELSLWSSCTL